MDAITGETIKSVFFELAREKDQMPEEGLTDPKGSYEFAIINTGTYTVRTRKAGYIPNTKTYIVTPHMLVDTENFFLVTIPLVKATLPRNKCLAILTSNSGLASLEFSVTSEKNE